METLALVPEPPTPVAAPEAPLPREAAEAPRSAQHPARLRVALVADGPRQSHWLAEAFRQTALAAWADVVLVLVGRSKGQPIPRGWRAYQRIEHCLAGQLGTGDDPAAAWDIRQLGARRVTLAEPASQQDIWCDEARRVAPDVVFLIGDEGFVSRLAPALADTARYGAWHFRFGLGPGNRAHWAGVYEVAGGEPMETASLVAQLADGSERLLTESWTRTVLFSVRGNRRRLLQRTALLPMRALRDLAEQGPDWLLKRPAVGANGAAGIEINGGSNRDAQAAPALLPTVSRIAGRVAKRGFQKLAYVDQWFLAYRFGNGQADQQGWQQDWGSFTCLMPPKDRFWADPFPIKWGERHLVFFEELPFATQRAHISVMEVDPDGGHSAPHPVLTRDYHLSYPFLFEAEGRLFMIPETGQNRTVELYSCQRIPDEWRLEKVLLRDACYVDASVHQVDGRWWMFVNVGSDTANLHDELHLYYADHFLGPWRAHRGNPVKSDVRSARSAGRLFEDDGKLYRPAQICAPLYGSGLSINQVQVLNPEQYVEQEVGRILPPRQSPVLGVHTLNRAGRLTVVDGFLRRRRLGGDVLASFEPERLLAGVGSEAQP